MQGSVAAATIFKLMSDIWMLSLLPTPFWDTNTQTAMPGIEPKIGKNVGEKPLTCHRQNEAEASEIK
jgi:hypothetical protein|nr:MAG TPA: hypothetical protein [Caudoviricetes sp.]